MSFDAPIIADEERQIELDWRYIHRTHQHGDLTVMLTWDWGGDQPQAVLMIAPSAWDRADGDPTIVLIHRGDCWKWSRTHNRDREMIGYHGFGKPPSSDAWQAANAIYYAERLGLNGADMRVVNRIRGLIEDYLGDLVMMPPAPVREGQGGAIVRLTDNIGRTSEVIVRDL